MTFFGVANRAFEFDYQSWAVCATLNGEIKRYLLIGSETNPFIRPTAAALHAPKMSVVCSDISDRYLENQLIWCSVSEDRDTAISQLVGTVLGPYGKQQSLT